MQQLKHDVVVVFLNLGIINCSYFVILELLLTVISQPLVQALILFLRFLLKACLSGSTFQSICGNFSGDYQQGCMGWFFRCYMLLLCTLCD